MNENSSASLPIWKAAPKLVVWYLSSLLTPVAIMAIADQTSEYGSSLLVWLIHSPELFYSYWVVPVSATILCYWCDKALESASLSLVCKLATILVSVPLSLFFVIGNSS